MYPHTKKILEEIAGQFNCFYGKEPSLSELLTQIGDGRLTISNNVVAAHQLPFETCFNLKMKVRMDLRGTIAKITEIIAKHEGNITKTKVESNGIYANLQILFFLKDIDSLASTVEDLQKIKIKKLEQFNEDQEFSAIAAQIGNIEDKFLDSFKDKNLIVDIVCLVGLKLQIKNKVGVLSQVTNQVARERFLISSIEQELGCHVNEAFIKLFLCLQTNPKNTVLEQINKVKKLICILKKIPDVENTDYIGVDYFR